jgi:hypothetical protein
MGGDDEVEDDDCVKVRSLGSGGGDWMVVSFRW